MDHIDNLRDRVEALEYDARRVERRVRWWRGIACSAVILALSSWALPSSTAQTAKEEYSVQGMARRLADLEYKLQYVTGGTNEVVITGANLRIVNGLGTTETTNGLGNLIVGYNELRADTPFCQNVPTGPGCTDTRTGSHNVVVGNFQNFSSFGGSVAGHINEISGPFASVSGGRENTASEEGSWVGGGLTNTASGILASVSGGQANTASNAVSSVSGGFRNKASGDSSSVSGGTDNTASGGGSSVSGGYNNTASGSDSSVSGGAGNRASGLASSVSGGLNRTAPEQFSWAAAFLFADDGF